MSEVVIEKNELPKNWKVLQFEEIISPVKHAMKRGPFGSALKKAFFVPEGYKVYEQKNAIKDDASLGKYFISDEKFSELEHFKVEPGDYIISCSGTIGRITRIPNNAKPGIINQALLKIKINDKIIEPQYFLYLFRSDVFQKKVLKETRGVAIKNIASVKDIKKLPVPLPSLEQQKRIVAKIEELFSHIDAGMVALKKAKQLLKQYRQSVLKAAVTGELTKEWREKNKDKLEPASQLLDRILKERSKKWEEQQLEQFKAEGKIPKDDKWKGKYKELELCTMDEFKNFPELPEEWVYTKLGNLIDDPKYGTSKKCSYDLNGKGVLRIPNIANGEVDLTNMKYAIFNEAEIKTYELKEDDILIIRSNGSVNLVGKCAIIGENDRQYLYAGYLIRLRPNQKMASGLYLINSLNSIYLRQQIEFKAKSTSGVNNINSGELQSLIVSICDIKEQIEINSLVEEKLIAMHRLDNEIEMQLIKAEKDKQSILASAFCGDLHG